MLRKKANHPYQKVWWPLKRGGWVRCEMWLNHLGYGEKYGQFGWKVAEDVYYYDPRVYAPVYFLLDLLYSEIKAIFDYAERKHLENGGKLTDRDAYADTMY